MGGKKIMNFCFNRLGEEFTLSRNGVDVIPVEHGEESCVSWIQARFSWKAIKKLRDAPSVFGLEKTLQSGWEIFCLCWIANSSAVGKLQPIPDKFKYFNLPISHSPFILSVEGQNREEKMQNHF